MVTIMKGIIEVKAYKTSDGEITQDIRMAELRQAQLNLGMAAIKNPLTNNVDSVISAQQLWDWMLCNYQTITDVVTSIKNANDEGYDASWF